MQKAYQEAYAHGDIYRVFESETLDIFVVDGTAKIGIIQFPRSMAIVRENKSRALSLINAVRLNDQGLKALDALGKVQHVVRIGPFHLSDDPFYVDTYRARLWSLSGLENKLDIKTDVWMDAKNAALPFPGASLFFWRSKKPEAVIYIPQFRLIITCDSVQNIIDKRGCNFIGGVFMPLFGFMHPVNIGPGWTTMCFNRDPSEPAGPSLYDESQRLVKETQFANLISAHGVPISDGSAGPKFQATLTRLNKEGSLSGVNKPKSGTSTAMKVGALAVGLGVVAYLATYYRPF